AGMKAGADCGNRDASIVEWNRMKDVARRGVAEDSEQLSTIGVETETGMFRDGQKILAEGAPVGIGDFEQAQELDGVIFLARRDLARPFAIEFEQQRSNRKWVCFCTFEARGYRRSSIDGLEIHGEVLAMTRRLGEAPSRVVQPDRPGITRYQPAAAAAALGEQSIAAEQRPVANNEKGVVQRHNSGGNPGRKFIEGPVFIGLFGFVSQFRHSPTSAPSR